MKRRTAHRQPTLKNRDLLFNPERDFMTENLAARGEGLAGAIACVKEFIAWATEQIGTSEAHGCAEQAEDALKLLEAAAPAGTSPDVQGRLNEHANALADYFAVAGEDFDWVEYHRERMKALAVASAALATPSPQAPATTPVDEPKNDDRAYGCYTCGKQGLKKGQRVSLVYCNECDAKHIEEVRRAAATQEQPAECKLCEAEQPLDESGNYHDMGGHVRQRCMREPAGSGASELKKGDEVLVRGKVKLLFADGVVAVSFERLDPMNNQVAYVESSTVSGSPRKVGEDGEHSEIREAHWQEFLEARGVETPCKKCGGLGTAVYGSTATWQGGIGGAAMTNGICDRCWGSGDENKHWTNLRTLLLPSRQGAGAQ